jgi:hypothetical protein
MFYSYAHVLHIKYKKIYCLYPLIDCMLSISRMTEVCVCKADQQIVSNVHSRNNTVRLLLSTLLSNCSDNRNLDI